MPKLFENLWNALFGTDREEPREPALERKYRTFKSLLAGNNHALEVMTELERAVYEGRSFTLDEVVAQSESLIGAVYDIVEDLNALSGGAYPGLFDAAEGLGIKILRELVRKRRLEKGSLVLPLARISAEDLSQVGGKAANLGEVVNRVGLPAPGGFAFTAYACSLFLHHGDLDQAIAERLRGLDPLDTEQLERTCEAVRGLIMAAELPADLRRALDEAAVDVAQAFGPAIRLAVRSSAACEDSEASFAGQHATVLGVPLERLAQAYKEVVASIFTPRAVFYRRSKGYTDDDVIMSVLCIAMVQARSSGVLYTVDPNAAGDDLLLSATWGLGAGIVDGSVAGDFWRLRRGRQGLEILERQMGHKAERMGLTADGQLRAMAVDEAERDQPCLDDATVLKLAGYGLELERHYGQPQDVEWAMDAAGSLYILQSRPLARVEAPYCDLPQTGKAPSSGVGREPGREPLLSGGQAAACGTACGPAYVILSDHHLHSIPQGAILVARQTSPSYVAVMGRVAGIITEVGSVTGHMASVAREFGIPTLVGLAGATTALTHGEEVTLDAEARAVYAGCVAEILTEKRPVNLMKGSPVWKAAQEALRRIAPLNLTDPARENFRPEGCETLHDIIRFAHEKAMQEMFTIGDEVEEGPAVGLHTGLPLRIVVVDLGGGLKPQLRNRKLAEPDEVRSVPLVALLQGMTRPGLRWTGGVGVSMGGFASLMAETMLRDPTVEGRFGGPNYAIISGEYLNFNGRLGYHFAVVDCYCGPNLNDNYLTFTFKGGAADIGRRTRRAMLVGALLKELRLKVTQKGDFVRGELKKFDAPTICQKLDWLGRLLGSVRLLDMVLTDDRQVDWYVEQFFSGNYAFERVAEAEAGKGEE